LGVGYLVFELRRRGVTDNAIYDSITHSRDIFLDKKGILIKNYEEVLKKKQCLETYNAVQQGLIGLLNDIKENSR